MGDACNKLKGAVWNCNGTVWSDPKGFLETYTDRDMIFYTDTHESPDRGLPTITGYTWESTHMIETRRDTGVVAPAVWLSFVEHTSGLSFL